VATRGAVGSNRPKWIRSPAVDISLALVWLPFALAAHAVSHDLAALAFLLNTTFLVSFLHQPLTLPLVYGDPGQYALRKKLYIWSPVVFVVAITLGLWLSFALVAIVAGLWNAEHTLMQRFGVTRIYGRKAGQDSGTLERLLLISWLVLAVVWIGSDPATRGRVARLPLGEVNTASVDHLTTLRPIAAALVLPVLAVSAALLVRWIAGEYERARLGEANPAKWFYVGSTGALFAWMLVDPVSGFIAYVGAHAIEYFVIVNHSLGSRYVDGSGGPLGATVRSSHGRTKFFAGYAAAIVLLIVMLERTGNPDAYGFAVLFLGGLHVFYDGFIWKLRRPAVARGLVQSEPMPANVSA
jgi:hypothetical protein